MRGKRLNTTNVVASSRGVRQARRAEPRVVARSMEGTAPTRVAVPHTIPSRKQELLTYIMYAQKRPIVPRFFEELDRERVTEGGLGGTQKLLDSGVKAAD